MSELPLAWTCILASLVFGCATPSTSDGVNESGSQSSGSETSTETETATETETETETGSEPDLPVADASVVGFVVDELGQPIAGLPITLCGLVCLIGNTDADGRFEILGVDAGVKVLEPALVPVGDDLGEAVKSWTRFFDFVEVGEHEQIVLPEPFVMLRVDNTVGPLAGPQLLELLPELTVGFDADAFAEAGALPIGIDEPWLGARSIPQELWPQHGLGDWTILAAWGLAVWDLEAPDVFAVQATLGEALAPGSEVAFLVADYDYGFVNGEFFEEPAILSDDGLSLSTPPAAGLDRATMWLAVTRNQ